MYIMDVLEVSEDVERAEDDGAGRRSGSGVDLELVLVGDMEGLSFLYLVACGRN
jgi:hypothetical protein